MISNAHHLIRTTPLDMVFREYERPEADPPHFREAASQLAAFQGTPEPRSRTDPSRNNFQHARFSSGASSSLQEDVRGMCSQAEVQEAQELREKLKAVFNYYAGFGDRMNTGGLKSSNFIKMMSDACVKNSIPKNKLDLIYFAENGPKTNMDFNTFVRTLLRVEEQLPARHERGKFSFVSMLYREIPT